LLIRPMLQRAGIVKYPLKEQGKGFYKDFD